MPCDCRLCQLSRRIQAILPKADRELRALLDDLWSEMENEGMEAALLRSERDRPWENAEEHELS